MEKLIIVFAILISYSFSLQAQEPILLISDIKNKQEYKEPIEIEFLQLMDVFNSKTVEEGGEELKKLGFTLIPGQEREEVKEYINKETGERIKYSSNIESHSFVGLQTTKFKNRRLFDKMVRKNGWELDHMNLNNYDLTYIQINESGDKTTLEYTYTYGNKETPIYINISRDTDKIFSAAVTEENPKNYNSYRLMWAQRLAEFGARFSLEKLESLLGYCGYKEIESGSSEYKLYVYGAEYVCLSLNENHEFNGSVTIDMDKIISSDNKVGTEMTELLITNGYIVEKLSKKEKNKSTARPVYLKEVNGIHYDAKTDVRQIINDHEEKDKPQLYNEVTITIEIL